ncbi:FecCD family ABC transporter permease [Actinoplanes friuliensis]|uniref:ABC transporter permease n=1 Tax=Actinoplanes friuliensis DSM 7358 TaxID=1246995 RepID=U5VW26_9ACTN|nr:iron chelate uptake ABC transporter family permease subunit [Actinoplanes friuliensis]AGZ39861.1 ABC transporter permease [Actinoplanes friuliensis DSM 7358]
MSVDFGRKVLVLRPHRRASARFALRPALVTATIAITTLAVAVVALGTGEFTLSPSQVVEALAGEGTRAARLVVVEWRLPRVLLALIIGAALGLAGAVFQALTRNPLGSPDIIGLNVGAYTGVLVVTVFVGNGYYLIAGGALVGGLVTALVVYLFAFKRGVQGFRLIIVGIAISAMLASANQWFIIKVDLQAAFKAAIWEQGTLNGLGWAQVTPVAVTVGALCVALLGYGHRLALLEMGEDAAAALGVRVEATRLAYLIIGAALTAVATAAAGPISFVALAAPQLAQRLTRTPGIALVPSAAMGAFLLMLSDWLAQWAFAPTQLPVGIVTVSVGGIYFVWLLARQARR